MMTTDGRPTLAPSAHRHDVDEVDIWDAWDNAFRVIEYEYDGEDRLLVIGPSRHGDLLEVVAVPVVDPTLIIHADRLRPSRYDYLR